MHRSWAEQNARRAMMAGSESEQLRLAALLVRDFGSAGQCLRFQRTDSWSVHGSYSSR